ncbi:MAG: Gfo/Idh/MocA family oxidoreductase [Alphaproteobacteria bacterium]|nr:Gfo/Idh/MocA family oxidoreductase [Alphaproteobacteria bacterium]
MMHIAILGGGRWAKTHVAILAPLLSATGKIDWFTDYNQDNNQAWLDALPDKEIISLRAYTNLHTRSYDGYIIATASHTHADYLRQLIPHGSPILCEKPFCYSNAEVRAILALSKEHHCPVSMNIEFIYASYLQDFKKMLEKIDIRNIRIDWQDPLSENRNGEIKKSDVYTPIAFDQSVHCWSLLYTLLESSDFVLTDTVYEEKGEITVKAHNNKTNITLTLNRFADRRIRRISVNDDYAILDFSTEPGCITTKTSTIQNHWYGKSPMTQAILRFLHTVSTQGKYYAPDPTAIENIASCITFCENIHILLAAHLRPFIKNTCLLTSDIKSSLIYYYCPIFVQKGYRPDVFSASGYQAFLNHIKTFEQK